MPYGSTRNARHLLVHGRRARDDDKTGKFHPTPFRSRLLRTHTSRVLGKPFHAEGHFFFLSFNCVSAAFEVDPTDQRPRQTAPHKGTSPSVVDTCRVVPEPRTVAVAYTGRGNVFFLLTCRFF